MVDEHGKADAERGDGAVALRVDGRAEDHKDQDEAEDTFHQNALPFVDAGDTGHTSNGEKIKN